MIGVRDLLLFDLWARDPVGGCFWSRGFIVDLRAIEIL